MPEAPVYSNHHLPVPREHRAAATADDVGWKVTVQAHMVRLGPYLSPQTDRVRGHVGSCYQEEVSADG